MLAMLGTLGDVQETSMLSEPTCPKRRSEGAGTAGAKRDRHDSECIMIHVYFSLIICYCSSRVEN